jgi:hypothetical protein
MLYITGLKRELEKSLDFKANLKGKEASFSSKTAIKYLEHLNEFKDN